MTKIAIGAAAVAHKLPVVVAGAGPAGAATAIGLKRAGVPALVLEQRSIVASRARNIFMRPQAREIMQDIAGTDPGRDTTIRTIENTLRGVAREEGVGISYQTKVVDLQDMGDHLQVRLQEAGSRDLQTIRASMLVDATGGRLAATDSGVLERVPVGPPHTYVTAQYDRPAGFGGVFGGYDRAANEVLVMYPVDDGRGFITYFDMPPGKAVDAASAIARYDAIAGHLLLGTPTAPPQAFDAQQHLSRSAVDGRVMKIGDSAGNADPYIGAGVAAALVDARTATGLLTSPEAMVDPARALAQRGQAASDQVLAGHRSLARQSRWMMNLRPIAFRVLPRVDFDSTTLGMQDLRHSRILDAVAASLTTRPIATA